LRETTLKRNPLSAGERQKGDFAESILLSDSAHGSGTGHFFLLRDDGGPVAPEVPETAAHDGPELFGERGAAPTLEFPDFMDEQKSEAFPEFFFKQHGVKTNL
jgi:hypothetical protein